LDEVKLSLQIHLISPNIGSGEKNEGIEERKISTTIIFYGEKGGSEQRTNG